MSTHHDEHVRDCIFACRCGIPDTFIGGGEWEYYPQDAVIDPAAVHPALAALVPCRGGAGGPVLQPGGRKATIRHDDLVGAVRGE